MLLVYIPIILIVLYYALYYYFTRSYDYWKKKNVKGPKPCALFGNLKETTLRKKTMSVLFEDYYNMFPEEKVVGIYRMTTPCLLIRDLDIIKHIMIKDFDLFKDRGFDFSSSGLGQNLFHADGDTWSALRARFTPIFSSGSLKNMYPLLNNRADIFINNLKQKCQTNSEFEMISLSQKFTVSTIFACAFGIDVDYFNCEMDDALKTLDKLVFTPNYALELDMMYPGILKKLDMSFFPAGVKKFFDGVTKNIISERNGKPSSRRDFMDLILQLRQMGEVTKIKNAEGAERKVLEITEDVITAQVFIFYVAGYETSATTLAFLFYYLSIYPDVQEKIIEELDTAMAEHGGEITYECLQSLKYLENSFKETLRMTPIVDPIQRRAKVDYKIPGTDLVIEKDQIVLVSARGIHNDEKYYINPQIFDPSRFDAEVEGARHSCSWLPFGVGPRNCIGMRFGLLQSRLGAAKILSKFRVESCENTPKPLKLDPYRLIVSPINGISLNLVPRTY